MYKRRSGLADDFKESGRLGPNFLCIVEVAFPRNENAPVGCGQLFYIPPVPRDIPLEFSSPEFGVGFRHTRNLAARMTMPETSVNEDYRSIFG